MKVSDLKDPEKNGIKENKEYEDPTIEDLALDITDYAKVMKE